MFEGITIFHPYKLKLVENLTKIPQIVLYTILFSYQISKVTANQGINFISKQVSVKLNSKYNSNHDLQQNLIYSW